MARTYHSSSASSGSSYDSDKSSRSDGSARSCGTANTSYSEHSTSEKYQKIQTSHQPEIVEEPLEISPRDSFATYASTLDFEDEPDFSSRGPMPRRRQQLYEADTVPATTHEFARLFPSSRRFMIQHDETSSDGNLQLRLDTETSQTPTRRTKKVTLFHLRMKNLKERDCSIRRYCRDSGREVAAAKKRYIKSTNSTPVDYEPSIQSTKRASKRLSAALHNLSMKPSHAIHHVDSGYASEEDDDDVDKQFEETLRTITSPEEDVISTPTESIKLDFSNYAQVVLNTRSKDYEFEYWGYHYKWKVEKHHDNGEIVYSYELYREGSKKRVAVIMPDALGAEEAHWEAKQGGWIPACSMRLLQQDITDHLGDVIVTTGLMSLTDDCIRRHFHA